MGSIERDLYLYPSRFHILYHFFSVGCSTMLSVAGIVSNGTITINELEGIWKEIAVA